MYKVGKIKFSYNQLENKLLLSIISLLSIIAIVPFFYLAQYNVPGASDDFFHGFNMSDKSYFDGIYYWYKTGYNGRFSNAFFMLIPGRPFLTIWFGKVFPIIIFISFLASIFYLVRVFVSKNIYKAIAYSLLLMTFIVGYTPSIKQFYWYSGTTVYIIPAILFLFLIGFLIRYFNKKQNPFQILISTLLLFFIIGSNENWMIIGIITIILFFLNKLLLKEKLKKASYFILIWTIACGLLMILAPGTTHRITAEADHVQNAELLPSLLLSISYIGTFIYDWFISSGLFIVGIAIMLMPNKDLKQKLSSSYSNIFLVLLLILIIYIGGFILSYSLGHFNHIRIRGIIPNYIAATFLFLYLFYKFSELKVIRNISAQFSINSINAILIVALVIGISNSANIKDAYTDIFTGNAEKQAIENKWVIDYIKSSKEQELSIPQLKHRSKILYSFSVPNKNNAWLHWVVTTYFNKKQIYVDDSQSFEEFMVLNSKIIKEEKDIEPELNDVEIKPISKEEKIKGFVNSINKDKDWLVKVRSKAAEKGIPLDSMILLDAIWMYEQELKSE